MASRATEATTFLVSKMSAPCDATARSSHLAEEMFSTRFQYVQILNWYPYSIYLLQAAYTVFTAQAYQVLPPVPTSLSQGKL
jgi:hypothetical protein